MRLKETPSSDGTSKDRSRSRRRSRISEHLQLQSDLEQGSVQAVRDFADFEGRFQKLPWASDLRKGPAGRSDERREERCLPCREDGSSLQEPHACADHACSLSQARCSVSVIWAISLEHLRLERHGVFLIGYLPTDPLFPSNFCKYQGCTSVQRFVWNVSAYSVQHCWRASARARSRLGKKNGQPRIKPLFQDWCDAGRAE